jgi:Flp pilus assembly protein TadD
LQRFAQADQAYSRAIAIAGATAEILNNQGYSYMLRGDYKHAHEKLIAAQRKDPHNKFVQNNLHLLEESARWGMAID